MEHAPINKIERHATLHDRVYLELKKALMAGRFPPGTSVTLRSLAAAVGTSEMPVRDAVRRLVVERALVNRPNRSVIVPVIDERAFEEITAIRVQLETLAASRAASTIRQQDIGALRKILDDMRRPKSQKDYLEHNQRFHFLIYEAAGWPTLLSMIESIWLQAGPLLNTVELLPGASKAETHHLDVVTALEAKDGKAAASAIAGDITDAADFILCWMRSRSRQAR